MLSHRSMTNHLAVCTEVYTCLFYHLMKRVILLTIFVWIDILRLLIMYYLLSYTFDIWHFLSQFTYFHCENCAISISYVAYGCDVFRTAFNGKYASATDTGTAHKKLAGLHSPLSIFFIIGGYILWTAYSSRILKRLPGGWVQVAEQGRECYI